MTKPSPDLKIDALELARAREYALLASLLWQAPNATLLSDLVCLRGDETPLGRAHAALADAAQDASVESTADEHFALFAGLKDGALCPYASHYLTDTVYGRPLAALRETLRSLEIRKAAEKTEPEDHISFLFEIMAGLAGGEISVPSGSDRAFFNKHLLPWAGRFFIDLESTKLSAFYRPVGTLGRILMDIEANAFGVSIPQATISPMTHTANKDEAP
jgi:TorA maturation chaperone TorD